jgi:hypothetical protein
MNSGRGRAGGGGIIPWLLGGAGVLAVVGALSGEGGTDNDYQALSVAFNNNGKGFTAMAPEWEDAARGALAACRAEQGSRGCQTELSVKQGGPACINFGSVVLTQNHVRLPYQGRSPARESWTVSHPFAAVAQNANQSTGLDACRAAAAKPNRAFPGDFCRPRNFASACNH